MTTMLLTTCLVLFILFDLIVLALRWIFPEKRDPLYLARACSESARILAEGSSPSSSCSVRRKDSKRRNASSGLPSASRLSREPWQAS